MPHLAPLKWLLLATMFWIFLLTSMSMMWWNTAPKMPLFSTSFSSIAPPKWPWL